MILSKADYLFYCEADRISLGRSRLSIKTRIRHFFFPDHIWKFQKILRKYEYFNNVKLGLYRKIVLLFIKISFRRISLKLGFNIPINVFGPGLSIAHYGTIVVNANAVVGANARVQTCVVIGASGGTEEAAKIGDNVYFGSGAKIIGDVCIPNNTAIGANALVNKSFIKENCLIAGIPAKIIGEIEIDKLLIKGSLLVGKLKT